MLFLLLPVGAYAEVEISGYATFGATYSNTKDTTDSYAIFDNGQANQNVQFDKLSHLGLQLSASVSEKVDMTAVLHAEGSHDNYNVGTQWVYATYRFSDDLSLRMGKYKGSFYMVSDYKDVGYAYPWVRPPLEVYSTNPIEGFSGLDLVYQASLGDISFLMELFAGSGSHHAKVIPSVIDVWDVPTMGPNPGKGATISFETPNAKGINLSLSGDIGTFRVGYFETGVNAAAFGIQDEFGSFGGVGFNIDWNNLVVYSEYIVRDTAPALAGAFPDQQAYYATIGYRIDQYLPYVTYAKLDKGKDDSPFAQRQNSIAFGVRAEVSDSASLKFEVMTVTPEKNSSSYNPSTAGYGLFQTPVEKGTVATVTFDVIF